LSPAREMKRSFAPAETLTLRLSASVKLSRTRESFSDKFGHGNCVILRGADFEPMHLTRRLPLIYCRNAQKRVMAKLGSNPVRVASDSGSVWRRRLMTNPRSLVQPSYHSLLEQRCLPPEARSAARQSERCSVCVFVRVNDPAAASRVTVLTAFVIRNALVIGPWETKLPQSFAPTVNRNSKASSSP
jgi:hypothetical protein